MKQVKNKQTVKGTLQFALNERRSTGGDIHLVLMVGSLNIPRHNLKLTKASFNGC